MNNLKIKKMKIKEKEVENTTEQIYTNVKNSPFTIVKMEEKYVITIGNEVVSDKTFNTVDAAKKYINKKDYNFMIVAFAICYDIISKKKEEEQNNLKN